MPGYTMEVKFGARRVLVVVASQAVLVGALLLRGAAFAQEAKPAPAGCTTGCHEEVKHDNAKHAKVTCVDCHPNVPDGKVKHEGALDDTPQEKMCATAGCHEKATADTLKGSHKDAPCDACHNAVHDGFTRFDKKACKQCHKEALQAFEAGVHGQAKKVVKCVDCHGDLHDPIPHKDPLSPMSKVLQITTCSECHDSKYVRAYRVSVHGVGLLKSGLEVAPACTDCHGAHDIAKVKDPASKLSRANVPNTCGKCHTFIEARWKKSKHGELWLKGDEKGPVCSTCHMGHLTNDPMIYGNHLKMADTCGKCHESQSTSYRDSFHGKATRMGFQVAATCADCHTPHDMLPAKDPHSSVNPANLKATCQRCHENANEGFIGFAPHLEPSEEGGPHPIVHYIWKFMTLLLLGTLGFFALHTLLWLQRSVVAFRKGEFGHATTGAQWVRRFAPVHIYIHITIVMTFLALAATGLPLKFSGEPWAPSVAVFFGGLGGSRLLHRVAGVLTFGYGIFFASYLLREVVVRKRRQLLWGWQSMVPNLNDLKDVIANIKWFLYLGPHPRLDRWAYWEKFDFFAVFWGVPVIGFSGVMLWNPNFFTQFLPGWAMNVAYLVHSDEALLATGFIFFFHFFHTHLRPEAFPLDPVIFTGSMPLERFKAERPVEYERLVKEGGLEALLVPPPTERTMRRVYRFGFTALAVGLLLGVGLFAAFFGHLKF